MPTKALISIIEFDVGKIYAFIRTSGSLSGDCAMSDLLGISNIRDGLFHKIKSIAGICTPNLKQTKDMLKKANEFVKKAHQTTSFISLHPDMPEQLRKANAAIGKVREGVSKLSKGANDVSAACEIGDAISTLNSWVEDKKTNAEAAAAFDKLFGGIANFASKLPPPTNAYADVLKGISVAKFFANMNRLGDSRAGLNRSTPTGNQMADVMSELDRQSGR